MEEVAVVELGSPTDEIQFSLPLVFLTWSKLDCYTTWSYIDHSQGREAVYFVFLSLGIFFVSFSAQNYKNRNKKFTPIIQAFIWSFLFKNELYVKPKTKGNIISYQAYIIDGLFISMLVHQVIMWTTCCNIWNFPHSVLMSFVWFSQ